MSKDLQQPLIEQKEKKIVPKSVSYFSLFRYADTSDKLYMFFGSLCALCAGLSMPFFVIFFGDISTIFIEENRQNAQEQALSVMVKFFIIGAATWFLNFVGLYSWNMTGSRQSLRFKKIYYETLLQQEIAWYDTNDVNKLSTQISGNMVAIETAIGQKISLLLTTIVATIFGFFYAFFKCWRLSLVLTALLPLMIIAGVLMMKAMQLSALRSKVSYENASGNAEQAFGAIKTVKSLVGEVFQYNKFIESLTQGQSKVVKYIFFSALSFGGISIIFLGIYSLGFWYGKQLIVWYPQEYDSPTIIATFFCFLVGGSSIGQVSPIMKNIAEGKVAAGKLFQLLERQKTLKEPENGVKLNSIQRIDLNDITFKYKKVDDEVMKVQSNAAESLVTEEESLKQQIQKQAIVLQNVNIKIPKGKVTALVGESGSGKSTIIQLLMRFYDPNVGSVKVNGIDLRQIDLEDYRKQIGFVGQEPILFSMSVSDNIKISNPEITEDEMKAVLRQANAYQFIKKAQNGLDTYVGTGGTQFSGGQKQRIAIARAIAKKPSMLMLDEATSALDRKNEKQIQKTLNNLSGSITTVVIAHRLSTVINADNIIVIGNGNVLEQGNHEELIAKEGAYYNLIKSQMTAEQKDENLHESIQDEEEMVLKKKESVQQVKSTQKKQAEEQQEQYTQQQLNSVSSKIFKESKESILYLIAGSLCAVLNGLAWPFFNIAFSNIMALLAQAEENSQQIDKYCLLFLVVAVAGGLCTFGYQFNFGVSGERLVYKLRCKLYKKILYLPISYFDKKENTPGAISTKLSQNTYQLHNIITGTLAVIFLNLSTVSVSLFLAFYYSWKLTLIVMGLAPLLVVTSAINMTILKGLTQKSEKFEKQVGSLISDSVCNARTVKSFGNNKMFISRFNERMYEIAKISSDKAFKTSFLQGLSRASVLFVQGLTFWIGAILFQNYMIGDPKAIYIAIFSIIFAAAGVGQNSQFMPDMGKAKHAGASIFQILETKDELQYSEERQQAMQKKLEGQIEFKNVTFKYPSRQAKVLNNFNLKIKKGQKIGFVGPSGSGKSTLIQLLLRFYDVQEGQILIDGKNINKYPILDYRRQLGLVSQEPTLFLGSVKDNLIYNQKIDGNVQQKLQQYAKICHAHQFINQWEQKFEKDVGQKGTQVSGGQKQRLALARCLVRKPVLFLLDESTSAMDTDTEQIVFKNLQPVFKNHTCISIAHRLSTIQDADRIVVMRDGYIIEEGKYDELMELGENFYRLAKGLN